MELPSAYYGAWPATRKMFEDASGHNQLSITGLSPSMLNVQLGKKSVGQKVAEIADLAPPVHTFHFYAIGSVAELSN